MEGVWVCGAGGAHLAIIGVFSHGWQHSVASAKGLWGAHVHSFALPAQSSPPPSRSLFATPKTGEITG